MIRVDFVPMRAFAAREIREALRNRWFLLFAFAFAILAFALSWLGLSGLGLTGIAGFGRTTASLVNLVMFIVPLMGLVMGAVAIAGERERGTLSLLLAQPITRTELLAGKAMGLGIALMAALLFGFGLSGLLIALKGGSSNLKGYLTLILFTLLLGWANLSLGLLLSALTPKNATALGFALSVWLTLLFFSDLGLIGTALVLRLPAPQLLWATLFNPMHAFKLAVLNALQGNLDLLGAAGIYARTTLGEWLSPILAVVLILWTIIPFSLALWLFRRREL